MSFKVKKFYPYFMWLIPLLFFNYQFILRLWPSLMMDQIMKQFAIDATAFGLLASFYYYGYASMQIPFAMLLDRFGPRLIVTGCALLCGLSTFVFTFTDSWILALISRLCVGAGSAVGFLASSKVISQWFSSSQYAKMVGITFTGGLIGAIYGGKPINALVQTYGWQGVATTLAFVSVAISLVALIFLRSPKESSYQTSNVSWQALKSLLKQRWLWILALANLLMVGSLEGFADVWGVNYLMTAFDFDKSDAAQCVSFIFVGMLFGGPLLASFSQRLGHYTVIALCGLGMALSLLLLLYFTPLFGTASLMVLFFLIGVLCCYQVLIFALGCDLVEASLLGVTVAFLNSINMLGGSFFHTLIGRLMDVFWDGTTIDQTRVYSKLSYDQALLIIPTCAIVGALLVLLLRWRMNERSLAKAFSLQT